MNTVLVWMLIAVSDGSSTYGNVTVVDHFPDAVQCQHVLNNIPNINRLSSKGYIQGDVAARCVQARIMVPK